LCEVSNKKVGQLPRSAARLLYLFLYEVKTASQSEIVIT
jgi:hypothetical protein